MNRIVKNCARTAMAATLLALAMAGAAVAGASSEGDPGSVLLFPLYDSSAGAATAISVTNTNVDDSSCAGSPYGTADIALEYVYFDGETIGIQRLTRYEFLAPGDKLSVLAGEHNELFDQGMVMVSAVDPEDVSRTVAFDFLLGSALVVQTDGPQWSFDYAAYAFDSKNAGYEPCNLQATDADGDGAADFDGVEYSLFSHQIVVPTFFEEQGAFTNQCIFATTAPPVYRAEIQLAFWNNRGQKFTRHFNFSHWFHGTLSDISAIVTNLNGTQDEFQVQTGWIDLHATRMVDGAGNPAATTPGVLMLFAERSDAGNISWGGRTIGKGTTDGFELPPGNRE